MRNSSLWCGTGTRFLSETTCSVEKRITEKVLLVLYRSIGKPRECLPMTWMRSPSPRANIASVCDRDAQSRTYCFYLHGSDSRLNLFRIKLLGHPCLMIPNVPIALSLMSPSLCGPALKLRFG